MSITSHSKIYFAISAILVLGSLVVLVLWGLKLGIDFTGGSLMEISFKEERPSPTEVQEKLQDLNLGEIRVQPIKENNLILRFKDVDEETHQEILKRLNHPQEERFESIGPIIGQELKTKALYSVILALIGIVVYIAWAFRGVSRLISSWSYGLIAILALFHDILITCGVFAVLGHYFQVEVNLPFVAALLTILGYSVNNTIVVFDRTRENLLKERKIDLAEIIDKSIKQSLARCLNTALTTLFVLIAIFVLGSESIKYFVLALIIGITVGTYSSIFLANPLLLAWKERKQR